MADTFHIADNFTGAYSYDRYGKIEWRRCADYLAELGLTEREIGAVLESKVMRWAADDASDPDVATRDDLRAWLTRVSRPFRGLGMRSAAGRRLA